MTMTGPLSDLRTRATTLWVCAIVVGLAASGCETSNGNHADKLTPAKAADENELLTQKDGVPYVVVNIADEVRALRGMDSIAQEEVLIRKGLRILVSKALSHKPYAGKDQFQLRLIVLHELDEYGRAKWGSMVELANFEVPRQPLTGLSASDLDSLAGGELRKLVRATQFSLGNLDRFSQ
jgi:hypothetical protein